MNDTPFWPSAVISSVGEASPPMKKKIVNPDTDKFREIGAKTFVIHL